MKVPVPIKLTSQTNMLKIGKYYGGENSIGKEVRIVRKVVDYNLNGLGRVIPNKKGHFSDRRWLKILFRRIFQEGEVVRIRVLKKEWV